MRLSVKHHHHELQSSPRSRRLGTERAVIVVPATLGKSVAAAPSECCSIDTNDNSIQETAMRYFSYSLAALKIGLMLGRLLLSLTG